MICHFCGSVCYLLFSHLSSSLTVDPCGLLKQYELDTGVLIVPSLFRIVSFCKCIWHTHAVVCSDHLYFGLQKNYFRTTLVVGK